MRDPWPKEMKGERVLKGSTFNPTHEYSWDVVRDVVSNVGVISLTVVAACARHPL